MPRVSAQELDPVGSKGSGYCPVVALVGNPNTGKTTLFNVLTGSRRRVGNFPGTTVEKTTGLLRKQLAGRTVELVDLPGTYSLAARSADEAVVLDALLGLYEDTREPDVIVSVVDATNLNRHLFLTTQLLELGKPMVIALNMSDLAESAGLRLFPEALAEELGVPVVPVVATSGRGTKELTSVIADALNGPPVHFAACFPPSVTNELDRMERSLDADPRGANGRLARVELLQAILNPGGYHEKRLINDRGPKFHRELEQSRKRITAAGEPLVEVEARTRYAWIERSLSRAMTVRPSRTITATDKLDRVLTHPVWGLMILLALMAMSFQAVYTWAGPFMDLIEGGFGWLGGTVGALVPAGALQSLLVNGVVAGVGAVLTFLPQIVILFLFIAIIEDCGYLARAAFLLDRGMQRLGLNGKAFIPLLSSFACAVPGIMATRVIEDRRDRFITILIAPLMSCSARLPVYTLLIGAFIPSVPLLGGLFNLRGVTLLVLVLLGVIVAVPVSWVLRRTLFRGKPQPFLMELPTYKWPSPRTVFFRVFDQAKAFCTSAGTMIFAVSIVVWALGYYPHSRKIAEDFQQKRAEAVAAAASAGEPEPLDRLNELDRQEAGAYLQQSVLGRLGAIIEPAVKPLGWDWRIGTAALASFPAREVVIATLGTLYNLGSDTDETSTSLRDMLAAATWPDGRPVYNLAVALSIMVFFALCCQCAATLATIRRETNSWRWPAFTFAYMTGLAYVGALATYQLVSRIQ